jgi:hypothetical protein
VAEQVAAGFTAVKMNACGRMSPLAPAADLRRVVDRLAAARSVLGPERDVAIDCHGRLTPADARRLLPAVADLHPLFVEEPVAPGPARPLGPLVACSAVPIALGERLYSRGEFLAPLQDGVAVVQPDLSHAGGISEVRRIASLAEVFGALLAPHCPLGPIALAASLQIAFATPELPDPGAERRHPLRPRQRPARLRPGPLTVHLRGGHALPVRAARSRRDGRRGRCPAGPPRAATPGATPCGGTPTAPSRSGERGGWTGRWRCRSRWTCGTVGAGPRCGPVTGSGCGDARPPSERTCSRAPLRRRRGPRGVPARPCAAGPTTVTSGPAPGRRTAPAGRPDTGLRAAAAAADGTGPPRGRLRAHGATRVPLPVGGARAARPLADATCWLSRAAHAARSGSRPGGTGGAAHRQLRPVAPRSGGRPLDRLGPDDGTATVALLAGCDRLEVADGVDRLSLALSCPGQPVSFVLWRNLAGWPPHQPYRSVGVEPLLGQALDLAEAGPAHAAVSRPGGRSAGPSRCARGRPAPVLTSTPHQRPVAGPSGRPPCTTACARAPGPASRTGHLDRLHHSRPCRSRRLPRVDHVRARGGTQRSRPGRAC